jgi:toxin-antitoxin system PIN domain toxin
MILLDVNVLVSAFRPEMPEHLGTKAWLDRSVSQAVDLGFADGVLCGFVRVVTQKPFDPVAPIANALDFVAALRRIPSCHVVSPNPQQWDIFDSICRRTLSHGKAAQDLYWASFALELACEFITFDQGFARIPGLRWRSPLEDYTRTNPR